MDQAYRARVAQLPKTWRNAHWPRNIVVAAKPDGSATLTADVTYLNTGMKPDIVRAAELTYTTSLKPGATVLPLFTSLEIAQTSESTVAEFTDAYAMNRCRSLLHYWFALVEHPQRTAAPVRVLLTPDFTCMRIAAGHSERLPFDAWFEEQAGSLAATRHEMTRFTLVAAGPATWHCAADIEWHAILDDGAQIGGRTRQTWTITDDPTQIFARISAMSLEKLPYT